MAGLGIKPDREKYLAQIGAESRLFRAADRQPADIAEAARAQIQQHAADRKAERAAEEEQAALRQAARETAARKSAQWKAWQPPAPTTTPGPGVPNVTGVTPGWNAAAWNANEAVRQAGWNLVTNAARGGAEQYGGSMGTALASLSELARPGYEAQARNFDIAHGTDTAQYLAQEKQQPGIDELYQAAQDLSTRGAERVEQAKTGLGPAGRLAVDVIAQGTQQALDAPWRLLGPSASLIPLFARSYGGGVQEAREAGADPARAALYGLASGAVEVGTEKMFDATKLRGGSGLDDILDKAIDARIRSAAGRGAAKIGKAFAGEAIEEGVSGVLNPALKSIYNGQNPLQNAAENDWGGVGYDMLVGGIMGGIGGTGAVLAQGAANAAEGIYRSEIEAAEQRAWDAAHPARNITDTGDLSGLSYADVRARAQEARRAADTWTATAMLYQEQGTGGAEAMRASISANQQAEQHRRAAEAYEAELDRRDARTALDGRSAGELRQTAQRAAQAAEAYEAQALELEQQQVELTPAQRAAQQSLIQQAQQQRRRADQAETRAAALDEAARRAEDGDLPFTFEPRGIVNQSDELYQRYVGGASQAAQQTQPQAAQQTQTQETQARQTQPQQTQVPAAETQNAPPAAQETRTTNDGRTQEETDHGARWRDEDTGDRGERAAGVAEGEGLSAVESRAGRAAERRESQRQRAEDLRAQVAAHVGEASSTQSQGLTDGTARGTMRVVPYDLWTPEMREVSAKHRAHGRRVTFFTGTMEFEAGGKTFTARGAISPDGGRVWIQADHDALTVEQISEHEDFHAQAAADPDLMEATRRRILRTHDEAELEAMIAAYVDAYDESGMSREDILEEILADAYAGIDIFDYLTDYEGATRFTAETRQAAQESAERANAVRGPPNENAATEGGVKFSRERVENLTEDDAYDLLERVLYGEFDDRTYIPLRKDTPQFLIDTVAETSEERVGRRIVIENFPLIGQVAHLRQNMEESIHGGKNRQHGLGPDGMLEAVKALDDPAYLILRKDGRVGAIVRYYDGRRHAVWVSIDFERVDKDGNTTKGFTKNPIVLNGYDGGVFNVLVTAFEPDDLPHYLRQDGNVILYDKAKDSLQRGSNRLWSSHLNKPSSADSTITQAAAENNPSRTKKSRNPTSAPSAAEALQRENDALRKRVETLNRSLEHAKAQMKTSNPRPELTRGVADRIARETIQAYRSGIQAREISDAMRDLSHYLSYGDRDGVMLYGVAKDMAVDAARRIVRGSQVLTNDETAALHQDILSLTRGREALVISKADAESIPEYGEWRRAHRKDVNVKIGGDGTALAERYAELTARYPDLFPEAQTACEMLENIAEVSATTRPIFENPYSLDMAAAVERCANDLLDRLLTEADSRAKPTAADQLLARGEARERSRTEAALDALERERARRAQKIREVRKFYQDQNRRRAEIRADSAARQRLLRLAKRLTNRKLPPASRAYLNEKIGDLDLVAIRMTGKKLTQLSDLMNWYDQQKEDPDFLPMPGVEKALLRLSRRSVHELTQQEVATLTEALVQMDHELTTRRKLIEEADARDTHIQGEEIMRDVRESKGSEAGGLRGVWQKYVVTQTLTPLRMVERIIGYRQDSPLYKAANALNAGQRKMLTIQQNAERAFSQWLNDVKLIKRIAGGRADEIEIEGYTDIMLDRSRRPVAYGDKVKVRITPAMRMSLWMHSQNTQNLYHIMSGGITVPEISAYKKGDYANAYKRGTKIKLTPSMIRAICADMTEQELAWCRAAQKWLDSDSRNALNETSLALSGVEIAGVDGYWHIPTDPDFSRKESAALKFDGTIEGMGSLQERIDRAAVPIMLEDFTSALGASVVDTSLYAGLAIPVRNWCKLMGVTTSSYDGENRSSYQSSVQREIGQAWGAESAQYLDDLLADLQRANTTRNGPWARLLARGRSNYAASTLTLNAPTALRQASSYPTAGAILGTKPLLQALVSREKIDIDLINRYTPLLWQRSQGWDGPGLADVSRQGRAPAVLQWLRGKNLPKGLNWIQGIDLLTVRRLWLAAELYVRDNSPDLQQGTDAYYQAVRDLFERVVEETQPNYTTMQQSALQRSRNGGLTALSMFKTQPYQNFNILYNAAGRYDAAHTAWINAADEDKASARADYEAAKLGMTRAIISQLVATAVFAGMGAIWRGATGKDDQYKDEEGKVTALSAARGLLLDMGGTIAGIVPMGQEVYDMASAALSHGRYYGVGDISVSAVEGIASAMVSLSGVIAQLYAAARDPDDAPEKGEIRRRLDRVAAQAAQSLGIPYANVRNLCALGARWATRTAGRYLGEYAYLQLTTPRSDPAGYYDNLYRASCDQTRQDEYRKLYDQMITDGWDKDKLANAMESRMKKAQGVDKISELPRRYVAPEKQADYSRAMDALEQSPLWGEISGEPDLAAAARGQIRTYYSDTTSGEQLRAKLSEHPEISPTEYALFAAARRMADQPVGEEGHGSYTAEESEAAIRRVPGLSRTDRTALWLLSGHSASTAPRW